MSKEFLGKIICIIPIVFILYIISTYAVNVVYSDDWDMVWRINVLLDGNLGLKELFMQHNESRIFFPSIFILIMSYISDYNLILQMYISFFLYISVFWILYEMLKKRGVSTLFILPVAILLFSIRQYENFLWGIQFAFISMLSFSVFCLYFFAKYLKENNSKFKISYFIITVFLGILSSFSVSSGLILWPVLIFYLIFNERKNHKKSIFFMIFFTSIIFILYFYGYNTPPNVPDVLECVKHPIKSLEFFFILTGNSIVNENYYYSLFSGMILVFFSLLLLPLKDLFKKNTFFSTLLLFSFFQILAITAGRMGHGAGHATISRYSSFTIIFVIALYSLYVLNKKKSILFIIFLCFLGFNILSSLFLCVDLVERKYSARTFMKVMLENYQDYSDNFLKNMFYSPEILKKRALFLKKNKLNVFSEKKYVESYKKETTEGKIIEKIKLVNEDKDYMIFTGMISEKIKFDRTLVLYNKEFHSVFCMDIDKIDFKNYIFHNLLYLKENIGKKVFLFSLKKENLTLNPKIEFFLVNDKKKNMFGNVIDIMEFYKR